MWRGDMEIYKTTYIKAGNSLGFTSSSKTLLSFPFPSLPFIQFMVGCRFNFIIFLLFFNIRVVRKETIVVSKNATKRY